MRLKLFSFFHSAFLFIFFVSTSFLGGSFLAPLNAFGFLGGLLILKFQVGVFAKRARASFWTQTWISVLFGPRLRPAGVSLIYDRKETRMIWSLFTLMCPWWPSWFFEQSSPSWTPSSRALATWQERRGSRRPCDPTWRPPLSHLLGKNSIFSTCWWRLRAAVTGAGMTPLLGRPTAARKVS